MHIVADLHIHSHYSRATSKNLNFEHLNKWAQIKGVQIVGTGDIAHPGWLQEMRDKLEPAEEGLFRLKAEFAAATQPEVPPACQADVRFLLAGEISNIYKKGDKTRKVHNVIFAPTLAAVEQIQIELEKIGNIRSDGRPILGLDSRDLFEIILEVDPRCYLIPAHIWTPWFSMLGSKSGFDSVEECFEDLTPHIFAVETGLSSDPPMNWRVSMLDRYTLVSNSDAHSPPKLAREATLFDIDPSYDALFGAMRTGDPATFKGTIEFFPEEGKYHYDGHRKCGVCWHPQTTLAHGGICPECGKPVTVGVMHRVETLADRPLDAAPTRRHPFHSLIPLPELLSEIHGVGSTSKRVQRDYMRLLGQLGSELSILLHLPLDDIAAAGGDLLAQGIDRMRRGVVVAESGYDGEYGVIKVLEVEEAPPESPQLDLFSMALEIEATESADATPSNGVGAAQQPPPFGDAHASRAAASAGSSAARENGAGAAQPAQVSEAPATYIDSLLAGLNPQQRAAAQSVDRPVIIVAGPGTGKTRTLTHRIAYLISACDVAPERVLAITFTNKAATEMRSRIDALLGADAAARVTISTFHALGAQILQEWGTVLGLGEDFAILGDEEREAVARRAFPDLREAARNEILAQVSHAKNALLAPDAPETAAQLGMEFAGQYATYQSTLRASGAVDFDDLIFETVRLWETQPEALRAAQAQFRWISVDEYQDINHAQYRLLRLLAADGSNLCVIGDPDQAIYGFRGADRSYFLSFEADYPGAQRLHLQQNYRSTQMILDAAQQVISREAGRDALEIFSEFVEQTKLQVYTAPTDKAEAEYVVHQIEQLVGGTSYFSLDSGRVDDDGAVSYSFADFAVLYRLGAQSHALMEAFDRSGIPYQTVGQTPFYARKEVRQILDYLWVLHNPQSTIHLERVLTAGIVPFPLDALEHLQRAVAPDPAAAWAEIASVGVSFELTAAQRRRVHQTATLLGELHGLQQEQSVAQLIERVQAFLIGLGVLPATDATAQRVQQLVRRATAFGKRLRAFLQSTTLQQEADAYDPRADRVTLMTLHAAKGLEFPVVFMVGCEEDLLPYVRNGEAVDVDEERRLFYVGMTRAQQRLMLLHARRRFLFGQPMENAPSRFVNDISQAVKEVKAAARRARKLDKPDNVQLGLFD